MDKKDIKRLSIIRKVCEYRKNKQAELCFEDGCEKVKETKVYSTRVRREEDGSKTKSNTETGHLIIECKVHGWKELFSTEQLYGVPLPKRMTTASESVPVIQEPSGLFVER